MVLFLMLSFSVIISYGLFNLPSISDPSRRDLQFPFFTFK